MFPSKCSPSAWCTFLCASHCCAKTYVASPASGDCGARRKFNSAQSSTYAKNGTKFDDEDPKVEGFIGIDAVTVCSLCFRGARALHSRPDDTPTVPYSFPHRTPPYQAPSLTDHSVPKSVPHGPLRTEVCFVDCTGRGTAKKGRFPCRSPLKGHGTASVFEPLRARFRTST